MRRVSTIATLAVALAGWSGCGAPKVEKGTSREVLPFIEDDYGRALSEATARNLPMFVEVWAPW